MLIEFSVANFKSFKDKATFSMVAANISSRNSDIDKANVFKVDDELSLLTSAAIYGANASGKSNLIAAIRFMRRFVMNSSRESQASDDIDVESFLLSSETEAKPSFFEMVFIIEGTPYRYGFEVTQKEVVSEWLYYVPTIREARLFERHADDIKLGLTFKEGRRLQEKTRKNALFLSVVTQFNGTIAKSVSQWFRNVNVNLGLDDIADRFDAHRYFQDPKSRKDVVKFIQKLDIDIENIEAEKRELSVPGDAPQQVKELYELIRKHGGERTIIQTFHRKSDTDGKPSLVAFNLEEQESQGTKKLFDLAFPLLYALRRGRIILIDELDARLHPVITREIIRLFNSNETNPKHAQLIFATHDTNLLNNRIFRRDQIWFVEKNKERATQLYSLAEYKVENRASVRNDASFEKDYIEGRYGAIPFLGDFRSLIGEEDGEQEPEEE